MLTLRVGGEVVAHGAFGVGRERHAEMVVERAHCAERLGEEVGVLAVVHARGVEGAVVGERDELLEVPVPELRLVATDLAEVDDVTVRVPQRRDETRQ